MAWRGDSWAEVVERAASGERRKPVTEREDPAALAARAVPWTLTARARVTPDGLVLGAAMDAVEIAFAQLYHVEPVDPWPSLAVGWVDGGESCSAVLSPIVHEEDDTFARAVEEVVGACERRVPRMTARGWLDVPVVSWERVEELPGEGEEQPSMRGYRMAPEAPDPVVARRVLALPADSLWTWIWARLRPASRRVEPREVVLTRRFVYVRSRSGERLRLPAETLRTSRATADSDTIYVFGRHTELLLVHLPECPVAVALDARVDGSQRR